MIATYAGRLVVYKPRPSSTRRRTAQVFASLAVFGPLSIAGMMLVVRLPFKAHTVLQSGVIVSHVYMPSPHYILLNKGWHYNRYIPVLIPQVYNTSDSRYLYFPFCHVYVLHAMSLSLIIHKVLDASTPESLATVSRYCNS